VIAASPLDVLQFWFRETPRENWFRADPAFDAAIRARFLDTWYAAKDGKLDRWAETKEGALARIVILDQFSRNMFRGKGMAFSTDAMARAMAKQSLVCGFDRNATDDEKNFFYLPLMHSEDRADQEQCVRLIREHLGEAHTAYGYALRHRDVIERFGRFPGRNAALGRTSTREEKDFLAQQPGGF
jgi:uncharacterized protein (DUF924 family)